jgi:small subunit ribosomal protein S3
MGRKVHPLGFRIGIIRDWQAKWYADKHYPEFIQEDVKIRKAIRSRYAEAGVSLVEIERQANRVTITIYTSRPGIVIGRGGQRVDETRHYLEELIGKRVQLNIQEIRQPELDAYLVARVVAEQMERRIAYRRAMKQALFRTMQAGAKGMRITCSGRLGGAEIARRQMMHQGRVPLHTIRADIDYGFTEAHTTLGRIGIKVWIYRGDILPEVEEMIEEVAAGPAVEAVAETEKVTEEMEKPVEEKAAAKKETAPAAEKEEAAKPIVRRVTRKKPTVEVKEKKPVEEEAIEKVEEAPVAEKEKEVEPRAKKAVKKKPLEEAAKKKEAVPAAEKEKEAKPKSKRVTKKKPAAKEEKPVEEAAEKEAKIKPKDKKPTKAKKVETKEAKKKVTREKTDKTTPVGTTEEIKEEKTDATTEAGKIQKEP